MKPLQPPSALNLTKPCTQLAAKPRVSHWVLMGQPLLQKAGSKGKVKGLLSELIGKPKVV